MAHLTRREGRARVLSEHLDWWYKHWHGLAIIYIAEGCTFESANGAVVILTTRQKGDTSMHLLEVLNPVAKQRGTVIVTPINPRPSTLDGKTIALLWSGTHGGDVALNRVGEMLQERFENISTRFYAGAGYPAPPEVLKQAAAECDVVVGATAD